jgi:hypothetical protein
MLSATWSGERIGGIAGIGFVVLFVVVVALGFDSPGYDDAAEVREFFVDHATRVHFVTWLGALAVLFFLLPFAAMLRGQLVSSVPARDQPWPRLSYTGAVLMAAIVLLGSAFWEVLSFGAAETLSDETLVALARFDRVIFAGLLPLAMALFVVAASIVILQRGVFARWIGWLGVADAAVLVIGTLWLFTENEGSALESIAVIGMAIGLLWVIVIGIAIFRRSDQVPEATT